MKIRKIERMIFFEHESEKKKNEAYNMRMVKQDKPNKKGISAKGRVFYSLNRLLRLNRT